MSRRSTTKLRLIPPEWQEDNIWKIIIIITFIIISVNQWLYRFQNGILKLIKSRLIVH